MARLVLEKDNGEKILLREGLAEDITQSDILIRSDYVATVLWSRDDIASTLIDKGYKDSDENIEQVIGSGELGPLGDCDDEDWNVINNAVKHVAGQLERL